MLAAEAVRHCFEAERADQQRQPKLRTARPIMPPSSLTAVVAAYAAKESRFTGKINWVQLTSVLTTTTTLSTRGTVACRHGQAVGSAVWQLLLGCRACQLY
jgi:hypothetical protein